jgi:hypothetical protein
LLEHLFFYSEAQDALGAVDVLALRSRLVRLNRSSDKERTNANLKMGTRAFAGRVEAGEVNRVENTRVAARLEMPRAPIVADELAHAARGGVSFDLGRHCIGSIGFGYG